MLEIIQIFIEPHHFYEYFSNHNFNVPIHSRRRGPVRRRRRQNHVSKREDEESAEDVDVEDTQVERHLLHGLDRSWSDVSIHTRSVQCVVIITVTAIMTTTKALITASIINDSI